MITLYFAPLTRAVRVAWLLEELGLPYVLERVEFLPTANRFFVQKTPTGKLPTIEDDGVVLCESGAIVEYLVERYGEGRLAPPVGNPGRAAYLQWLHFAESTAFPPLGILAWLTRYRKDAESHADLIADTRARALSAFEQVEKQLGADGYILGDEFSAADVMLGFTLAAAQMLGVLDDSLPKTSAYLARLWSRPALQKVAALK